MLNRLAISHKKIILYIIYVIILSFSIFHSGCLGPSENREKPDVDEITNKATNEILEIIATEPSSPSKLKPGDKLLIIIFYDVGSYHRVQVRAKPYKGGMLVTDYRTNHYIGLSKDKNQNGVTVGWLSFSEPKTIDEIRIFMQDETTKEIIKTITHKINARWSGKN